MHGSDTFSVVAAAQSELAHATDDKESIDESAVDGSSVVLADFF